MLDKIRSKIAQLKDDFLAWFTLSNIVTLLLWIVGLLAGIALFIFICQKIARFIMANYELLLICASIVIGFIYWAYSIHEKRKVEKATQLQTEITIKDEQEKLYLEDNYSRLQTLLYQAINDTADITHIPQLQTISALEAPTHWIQTNGFYVYQYLVAKDSRIININMIKDILNNRIRQALYAGEVIGITQAVYSSDSDGRSYPKITIDSISDAGTFLQINLVMVCETYTKYIKRLKAVNSVTVKNRDNSDFDF